MLPNGWTELVALPAAFLISALTTPAGMSGAVLLPFQVSVPWATYHQIKTLVKDP